MIVIGKTKFEFQMGDEKFALSLYGKWDTFCYSGFQRIADEILSAEDREHRVIQVNRLCLDLGTLLPEDFYEQFPLRLAEELKMAFRNVLNSPGRHEVKEFSIQEEYCRTLIYYLLHGHLKWDHISGEFNLGKYIHRLTGEKSGELQRFLRSEGWRGEVRKRLVFQLNDSLLESLVMLTESGESEFINRYTRFLIHRRPSPTVSRFGERAYRDMVWWLVLVYLWADCKGYFSRKELVRYTLRGLSARLGISLADLVMLLIEGVDKLLAGDMIRHDLLEMLEDIRLEEEVKDDASEPERREEKNCGILSAGWIEKRLGKNWKKQRAGDDSILEDDVAFLREQLADVWTCRKLLSGRMEKEIYQIVAAIIPLESRFIITYAAILEQEKEKGMFEGKAGHEFRMLKWEFIFALLSEMPAGRLDRKCFVMDVLHRLAAHYGMDYLLVVGYFSRNKDNLPVWLANIFAEIERSIAEENTVCLLRSVSEEIIPDEQGQLRELLGHRLSCGRLLARLDKREILRIVRLVTLRDEAFIVGYAAELEREKEKGMFEGRAGKEFEILKWEFIFQFALRDAFNRKHFALQTLQELAAHYALRVKDLLDYFYHSLVDDMSCGNRELVQVITELWQEMQAKKTDPEPLLRKCNAEEEELGWLKDYLLTGYVPEISGDIYAVFIRLKDRMPARLLQMIRSLAGRLWLGRVEQTPELVRMNAGLLNWLLKEEAYDFSEDVALDHFLQAAHSGDLQADIRKFRFLLDSYLSDRMEQFRSIPEVAEFSHPVVMGRDVPVLLKLFSAYYRPEPAHILREQKEQIYKLLLTGSSRDTDFLRKLRTQMQWIPGLAEFVKEMFGEERFLKILWGENGRVLLPGKMNAEVLRNILNGTSVWAEGRRFPEKLLEDKRVREQVAVVLRKNEPLLRLWIERVGNGAVRRIGAELLQLEKQLSFSGIAAWEQLIAFTFPEYADFSASELYVRISRKLFLRFTRQQKKEFILLIAKEQTAYPLWKKCLEDLKEIVPENAGEVMVSRKTMNKTHYLWETETAKEPIRVEVQNAGLVLLVPWFTQLFNKSGLLKEDRKEFTGTEAQLRAVFILQALVYGKWMARYKEYDLFLNRLLTGLPQEEVLPGRVKLTRKEKRMTQSLLKSVIQYWTKLGHISVDGFRHSFMQREGLLEEREDNWVLTVNRSGIDVLMDSMPWSFSMVKLEWMEKMITVEWR